MPTAEPLACEPVQELIIVGGAFPRGAADQAEKAERRVGNGHTANMRKRALVCNGRLFGGDFVRRGCGAVEIGDVVARQRHSVAILRHLDLKHDKVALPERCLSAGEIEFP